MIKNTLQLVPTLAIGLISLTSSISNAAPLPKSAEIYSISQGINAVQSEQEARATVVTTGTQGLSVEFPSGSKYPAINFKSNDGIWDMSGYNAIEATVVNTGTVALNLALRIDNPGNWKEKPWSSTNKKVAPGKTETITARFGYNYGKPGYALDPTKISNVKLMAGRPKPGSQLLMTSIKAVKLAEDSAQPAQTAVSTNAQLQMNGSTIFNAATTDINVIESEQSGTVLKKVTRKDGKTALDINFDTSAQYPAVNFLKKNQSLNLAAFSGVEAELYNAGTEVIQITLRVDNPGSWKNKPWNVSNVKIKPGETQNLRVTFGESNNAPGYPLNPQKVTQIKLFAIKPKSPSSLQVSAITCISNTRQPASQATVSTNYNVPSIEGYFYEINENADLNALRTHKTTVSLDKSTGSAALKVNFDSNAMYPNIAFPCPEGGWNMETFGGIQAEITNLSDHHLPHVIMRVDNPPTQANQTPWNNEKISLEPGETKTISLTFGGPEGSPDYPLDTTRISGIQIFQAKPKADNALLIRNLRAHGSPRNKQSASWASTEADRSIPVTPPEWLGKRPPVDGDWVVTLDENFDGPTLNTEIWTPRLAWEGIHKEEIARNIEENVYIEDGAMVIKAEINPGHHYNDPSKETREYAAGAANTYDKWTQCYGYVEARVKLPTTRGLWPAFWTMPDRGADAGLNIWQRRSTKNKNGKGMEIDILEHLTEWGPGRNNVAVHWDGYGNDHKSWGSSYLYFGPTPDGWHVFGLLWEPNKLTWYIDGKKKCEWENENIIDVPSHLILNLQMGRWATKDVDRANLPDFFKIDYVRAWQLKERM